MKKIKLNKKGFTFAEMLISVMLLGFLSLVVGAGSSAAMRVYTQGMDYAESRATSSTLLNAMENELRFAYSITETTDGKTIKFRSSEHGEDTRFVLHDDGMIYVVSGAAGYETETLLLGEKVYPNDVRVKELSVKLAEDAEQPVGEKYGKLIEIRIKMNNDYELLTKLLNVNMTSA